MKSPFFACFPMDLYYFVTFLGIFFTYGKSILTKFYISLTKFYKRHSGIVSNFALGNQNKSYENYFHIK